MKWDDALYGFAVGVLLSLAFMRHYISKKSDRKREKVRSINGQPRCAESDLMCGQCELQDGHKGKHLAGMNVW